ncbi:MAG: carbohydrate ABC transporter permease [Lachnospiraceae bacterium]|nr:carbohydrate ABC transporter permease [Lachnospiraceae bacterium]MCI9590331.1 carbohydrate ABC transporter permease [Lachnospiraceae bacterium]
MNKKKFWGAVGSWVLIVMVLLITLFPVWWIVMISLKTSDQALTIPPKLIFKPTLENYRSVLFGAAQNSSGRWVPTTKGFLSQAANSLAICLTSTFLALIAGVPAAYALSKFRFKKKQEISFFILSTRFMPPIVVVIPLFLLYRQLGLMDTRLGLIILYTFISLSLVIWMMKGFFDDMPVELIESARVDGCSRLGALFKVAIPVTRQGIVASAILTLIGTWNEFLFAVIFTSKNAKTVTLSVMGYVTIREVAWANMAAAGILITIPVLIFTIITQKHLVQGLTSGAVKG